MGSLFLKLFGAYFFSLLKLVSIFRATAKKILHYY